MKQFLAIILVACLSLALFAGCQSTNVDEKKPGATTSTEETTGKNPTDPTGTTPTEPTGTEPTEPTGTNPTDPTQGSNATEPTEGNGTTEPTDPSTPTVKGERITEEQFNAIITNAPTNYTYTETRIYNGQTQLVSMMISGNDYLQVLNSPDGTRKILGIWKDDHAKAYMYNEETGKWETSNIGISTNFPLDGFPYPLSNFTYDETTGAYKWTLTSGGVTGEIQMVFKDGQLIHLGIYQGENTDDTFFSDYGTTVIPMPDESDIVDKENSGTSVPSDRH